MQNVLAFTRTTGFRHDSIEAGFQALQRLGGGNGFAVDRTESPADFNDDNLALYDVVVWLNTDSIVLDAPARAAFQRYIRAGGGWVGVHAASCRKSGTSFAPTRGLRYEGGRAWYTVLGHNIALYSDARFTQHLLGGIQWAAGAAP